MTRYNVLFCPNCATPVVPRLLYGRERKTCPACGWIQFEDPKVAAGVLIEQDGQVLLVKRLNHPRQGLWSFPAGFVDAGEDPARAAERECLEETGLQARVTRLLEVVAGREHGDGADIVIVYAASIVGGSLHAGDDAAEAAFFPRSALPPLAFYATEVVLKTSP